MNKWSTYGPSNKTGGFAHSHSWAYACWIVGSTDNPLTTRQRSGCNVRLAGLRRALSLYAQDYAGFYPPTSGGAQGMKGWAGTLSKQQKVPFNVFVCYGNKHHLINTGVNPNKTGFSEYWMNEHLSCRSQAGTASSASTLSLGDGNDGMDVSDGAYSKTTLSLAWLDNPNSPASRHMGGANYVMVDGTVHWLRPEEVNHFGERRDAFALK